MVTARWCPGVTSHCDSHHKRIIVVHFSLYNDSATWLLCTEDDNSCYRNVCKMSVVSFALAVVFIINLVVVLEWTQWGSSILLVAFLLVNALNCHLSLVLASVVQGDAVNCNKCYVAIMKCRMSANASNYDLQNVEWQSLIPSCKNPPRSPMFAKGAITNLSDVLKASLVSPGLRTFPLRSHSIVASQWTGIQHSQCHAFRAVVTLE